MTAPNGTVGGSVSFHGRTTSERHMPESGKKRKVHRVMHEYKHGDLKTRGGRKVRSRKQAVAIAMSESGQSRKKRGQRSSTKSARGRGSRSTSRGRTAASRRSKASSGRKARG